MNHVSRVATQGAKERPVSVHDDESELLIRFQQLGEGFGMELVVTEVERGVDGLEGFEIDVDLSLLSFRGENFTTIDDQAIWWNLVIQLKSLLGRSNGREDGLTIDTRLDIGGGTLQSRDLVNGGVEGREGQHTHILQPTFSPHETLDLWALFVQSIPWE